MSDVFTELLDLMRVRSTAFVGKNLSAPWSIEIGQQDPLARFHLVLEGQTWMGLPDGTDGVVLNKGDLAIIPHGLAHIYHNVGNTSAPKCLLLPDHDKGPYFHSLNDLAEGDTNLLCGYFHISEQTPPTVVAHLPNMLVERGADDGASVKRFDLIVSLIRQEVAKDGTISPMVLNRLTEVLCLYAIQNWLTRTLTDEEHAHLRALADPKVKLVLDKIHDAPAEDWTVDALARLFGRSRTAFASHFKSATGLSPISYVRRWRIRLACNMLESTKMSIDEIAFKVGYSDTNAFNRAFNRETGTSPGAYKRMLRA